MSWIFKAFGLIWVSVPVPLLHDQRGMFSRVNSGHPQVKPGAKWSRWQSLRDLGMIFIWVGCLDIC